MYFSTPKRIKKEKSEEEWKALLEKMARKRAKEDNTLPRESACVKVNLVSPAIQVKQQAKDMAEMERKGKIVDFAGAEENISVQQSIYKEERRGKRTHERKSAPRKKSGKRRLVSKP